MFAIGYNSLPRSNLSEPLGQFTDQAGMFVNENGLETVSEENRRNELGEHAVDGFYRESYDPEMTNVNTQATFLGEGHIPLQTTAINNDGIRSTSIIKSRKFSLLNAFIPSFVFVILAMTISAIFVLETDSEIFAPIRNWPEMNSLRFQYYQPLKEFITTKINHIF